MIVFVWSSAPKLHLIKSYALAVPGPIEWVTEACHPPLVRHPAPFGWSTASEKTLNFGNQDAEQVGYLRFNSAFLRSALQKQTIASQRGADGDLGNRFYKTFIVDT